MKRLHKSNSNTITIEEFFINLEASLVISIQYYFRPLLQPTQKECFSHKSLSPGLNSRRPFSECSIGK